MKTAETGLFSDTAEPPNSGRFAGERRKNMPSPNQLRADAEILFDQARELRKRADLLERRARDRREQLLRDRAIIAAAMRAERGASDDTIVSHLAAILNGNVADAHVTLTTARRKLRRVAKAQRNRRIMQLACRGWTNGEIAQSVGLAEKTVSRLVASRIHREEWQ